MSEKLANPAPLGLLGFGITTALLNFSNAGLYPLNSMILAMGIAYGGLAQILAGIMEFRRGNTFGMVAFSSYGFFWWSLVALLLMNPSSQSLGIDKINGPSMAAYFFMWGLFTLGMFFGTLKANRTLQFVFMSLTILFFLLAIREGSGLATGIFPQFIGAEGVVCGLSAVYLAIAEILNEAHGKTVLPIGKIG
jgi:succinate-acetate transporter protein